MPEEEYLIPLGQADLKRSGSDVTILSWPKTVLTALDAAKELAQDGIDAEAETDKTAVEVESPADGILLKQYYSEWEIVPCGTPVAFIGSANEPIPSIEEAAVWRQAVPITETVTEQTPELTAEEPATSLTPGGRIRSSPRARRLAEQEQVDLRELTGSGEYGRITEQDVREHLTATIHPSRRIPSETVAPLTGVRKVTARCMMQSLTSTAQAQHRVDVDATALIAFRKQVNARLEKSGIKVSFVDILIMACAKALIEHPMANASLMEDGLHLRNFANVGFAADTEKGLVVPVVRDADVLSLPEIAKASRNLIEKAKTGKLQAEDMTGGTFTISNLGMYEIDSFTAVLSPPETCILAVGRIADRVVAENGQMMICPMMNLSLTCDHQVLDGAPAARFLQTIKHYIENPVWLLL